MDKKKKGTSTVDREREREIPPPPPLFSFRKCEEWMIQKKREKKERKGFENAEREKWVGVIYHLPIPIPIPIAGQPYY